MEDWGGGGGGGRPGIVHQGTDYTMTDKPSPATSLKATRGQTTPRQTSLPLGLFTRGQTTPIQTSLPLAPLSKLPEDRLH